jgi:fructose-bisphosphate aldolase class II
MIVSTNQLYKVAYKKFAVGAYNINNLEQTMGLFRGTCRARRRSSFSSRKARAITR